MKQTAQNYLKAIFSIGVLEGKKVIKVKDISKRLDISPPAVTDMVKRLESEKYVKNKPYKGVELTQKGLEVGREMVRYHRIWETYLFKELGLPWDRVHEEAERLEHACSDYLISTLESKLGYPKVDPHGNPIPDKNGKLFFNQNEHLLSALKVGEKGKITRVVDLGKDFLKYLESSGITLQTNIKVEKILDFDQSYICLIGKNKITISHQATQHIFIEVAPK